MDDVVKTPLSIQVIRGAFAEALISHDGFVGEWRALWRRCPWSTAMQSPEFVLAWYRTYRERFEPVLLLSRDGTGGLNGLLMLAVVEGDAAPVIAGAHQAEYQTWICEPELADAFPWQAIRRIQTEWPAAALSFRYLPPGTPLHWTKTEEAERFCHLRPHRRPLLRLGDGREIEESLRKSGNKSRLRQMKKLGCVEFKRIEEPRRFLDLLDEIVALHDARHLVAHGSAPFVNDSLKRDFHLAMMNAPGLLHITTLRVGGVLASAHLNMPHGRELQLNLITHNPRFDHFSPGKLHLLFLARLLRQEGLETIDLTPGGDAYKDRFANAGDLVYALTAYPTSGRRIIGVVRERAEDSAKHLLTRLHLTPGNLRKWIGAGRHGVNRVA
jgi:CelD/BcsL family acetyltransferase involved in cellulose biosynthesis